MSPDPTQRLNRILTTFDAERLGEGDTAAGANVLAAMACSLANVHRRGAGLASGDGPMLHAGSSLLVSGPLSSSLIAERVVGVLAAMQANLLTHLDEWDIARQFVIDNTKAGAPNLKGFTIPFDLRAMVVLDEEAPFREQCFDFLIDPFPNQMSRALVGDPQVYVTGSTPSQLRRNLERSHLGRPLVYDVIHSAASCAALGEVCLPVIDGSLTTGPRSMPVRGHLLLGDPSCVLGEALRAGGEGGRWLLRLPWLVDGNAGPEPPASDASTGTPSKLDRIEQRYELAMRRAWRCRIDHLVASPEVHAIDMEACQAQWVAFLLRHETSFPGISSAARPLVATLVFGLYEMVNCLPLPAGWRFDPFDAVSLAGWLVQRMCNARAVMLHSGEQEIKRRKHQGIIDKLGEGPMSARDLSRRFHRLTTVECRGLLHELGGMGQVVELPGDRWRLAIDAIHHETQALVLTV